MPDGPDRRAVEAVLAARPGIGRFAVVNAGARALHVFVEARDAPAPDGEEEVGDAEVVPLPEPEFEPAAAETPGEAGDPFDPAALGRLLGALAGRPGPIPKYRYPSAGTLYPVQAYLCIAGDAPAGLARGGYYHDPDAHALIRLSDAAVAPPGGEEAGILLLLVARDSAIVPIYGEHASDFCWLEAGYMSEVLMREADAAGLRLDDLGGDLDALAPTLAAPLRLEHDHVPLVGWSVRPSDEGDGLAALRRDLRAAAPTAGVHLHAVERLPFDARGRVDEAALRGLAEREADERAEGSGR